MIQPRHAPRLRAVPRVKKDRIVKPHSAKQRIQSHAYKQAHAGGMVSLVGVGQATESWWIGHDSRAAFDQALKDESPRMALRGDPPVRPWW